MNLLAPAPSAMGLSDVRRLSDLAWTICADLGRSQIIYRRDNRAVLRHQLTRGTPVIVKLWARSGLKGTIRWLTRSASCDYEHANLVKMRQSGGRVPRSYGACRISPNPAGFTEALFLEDLGDCTPATDFLKQLIRQGREEATREFEETLIDLTIAISRAGLIDTDHGLVNTVVLRTGEVARLDLEMARPINWPFAARRYGEMMGRLLGTYTFAVQPDAWRVARFAQRLGQRLPLSPNIRARAREMLCRMLEIQRREKQIDVRVDLGW